MLVIILLSSTTSQDTPVLIVNIDVLRLGVIVNLVSHFGREILILVYLGERLCRFRVIDFN